MEDVHHEVEVIDQHPTRFALALDVDGPYAVLLEAVDHRVGDGGYVRVAGAACHHEPVGGRRDATQVQQGDVDRLAVEQQVDRTGNLLRHVDRLGRHGGDAHRFSVTSGFVALRRAKLGRIGASAKVVNGTYTASAGGRSAA